MRNYRMSLKSFGPVIVTISLLPCAPLSATDEAKEAPSSSLLVNFIVPTVVSIIPQLAASGFTAWAVGNPQLGLDVYRGIRCFELGARGLQRIYDYVYVEKSTDTDVAVMREKDLSLNRDMFGYLLADTVVLSTLAELRPDLLVHHLMALTVWGSTLLYGVLPEFIAMNTAAELLSAFKGVESAAKGLGNKHSLRNQRILKAAYAFRLAVILAVRYPIWLLLDWKIPDQRYEEIGPVGYVVFRALNVAILGLETLWLYQTGNAFRNLRFR